MYAAQLLALDDTGGEVLNVTVAGDPKVTVTQLVSVSGLVAIPWAQGDRSGVAFRADAITPTAASSDQASRTQK
ncbi:putative regulatory protein [Mycobacterium kansasii 824]|uniref:Putative regulatory protein n=1 Tax=Mycobacterium kansasii TaxID=1768 RepID=A0A1V3WMK0_MYCKA|nr:putative regulatory protein [Mycobacterium kansasii 824]KEP41331.1 regulatory protein [Mycobacterium kansasii]OOK68204.1 putative regulatory protein [Mycobacterium kansasii]OOK72264.1 putative regulatory protein [Mycobacterium kansasii]